MGSGGRFFTPEAKDGDWGRGLAEPGAGGRIGLGPEALTLVKARGGPRGRGGARGDG